MFKCSPLDRGSTCRLQVHQTRTPQVPTQQSGQRQNQSGKSVKQVLYPREVTSTNKFKYHKRQIPIKHVPVQYCIYAGKDIYSREQLAIK